MTFHRTPWTAVGGLLCLAASPVLAAADSTPDATNRPPIVIVANRLPTPLPQVASSVTVITSKHIELEQERTLPDVLRDVPGLNLVQTGGPGGSTSLFIRGANSNHTKVLMDGIDISDPSNPTGAFQFSNFLSGGVRQVEVLRGPQSGLYGSDAIGGVVNILTETGSGPPHGDVTLEGGSFGTFNQEARVAGSQGWFNYALDLDHVRSADTPVTPLDQLAPGERRNDDFYDNITANAKLGAKVNDSLDASVVVRSVHSDLRFTGDSDVFFGSPDPVQSQTVSNQMFTRGAVHWALFGGRFDETLGLGYTDYRNDNTAPNNPESVNNGNRIKLDYQADLKLARGETLLFGAEHQVDAIQNSPVTASVATDAGFVQIDQAFGQRLFNTMSLRYDANSRFGGRLTYRIAPEIVFPETGTTIRGSVGTGFKAPTLFDLLVSFPPFYFANPDLKPETSLGYDIGIEQVLVDGRVTFGATYFHNDIQNLINFNDTFTTQINVGQATTDGVEAFVSLKPIDTVTLRGDYTYTDARDDMSDEELLRRPKHRASFTALWQATPVLSATLQVLYVGSWIDGNRAFTISRLNAPAYATVNVTVNYDVTPRLTLFGRIDNLLNAQYQNPVGFDGPRIGAFGGIKAKFGS